MALTASELATLADAAKRLYFASAVETPFDDTVIYELGLVAASSGFSTAGAFKEAAKLRPFSTMILFVAFAGGSGVALPALQSS
jgi:hypothetical protein